MAAVSWISDGNTFRLFLSTGRSDTSYQVSSQLSFIFYIRKFKIDFENGRQEPILDKTSGWF